MDTFAAISMAFVLSGILSALILFADEYILNNRQPMKIMNFVWILTGLWAGVFGLIAYYKIGRVVATPKNENKTPKMDAMNRAEMSMQMDSNPERKMSGMEMPKMEMPKMKMSRMEMSSMPMQPNRKMWQQTTLSTLHCGAGCTLADILGEWFLFFIPMAIGWGWGVDYVLALAIGVLFQFAAIRAMDSQLTKKQTFQKAFKADFWSLTSWQIGMFGFIAIVIFVFDVPLQRNSWEFWFFMQMAMVCGFFTAYPTNRLLIRLGIKKGM